MTALIVGPLTSESMPEGVSSVSNALDKLHSFDADLRFMGLNDIQDEVKRGANSKPSLVSAVVERLNDQVSEVQNQAIKTLDTLARAKKADINAFLNVLISQDLPSSTQAVAIRTVVDVAPRNSRSVPDIVIEVLLSNKEDGLLERLDALFSLVTCFGQQFNSDQVDSVYKLCSALTGPVGLKSRRALDVLVALAPYQQVGQVAAFIDSAQPLVSLRLLRRLDPSLCHEVAQIIPGLHRKVLHYARLVLEEGEDATDLSESAIRAAASLGIKDTKLVEELISWNPADEGDDFMSLDGNEEENAEDFELDDESEELDESYRIRRAAAALAVSMAPNAQARNALQRALSIEHDAGVRTDMTEALRAFVGPDIDISACIIAAERDRNEVSLKLLRDVGPWVNENQAQDISKLAKQLALSKRRLIQPALEAVKSTKKSTRDSDAVILAGLAGDHSLQTVALQTAQSLKSVEVVSAACNVIKNTRDVGLRSLGLQYVADNVAPSRVSEVVGLSLQLMRTEPSIRVPAAHCLTRLWQRGLSFDSQGPIRVLSEVLATPPLLPTVGMACLSALESAPVSDDIANAASRVASDRLYEKQAKVMNRYVQHGNKHLIRPILDWSLQHEVFPWLIESCAAVEPDYALEIAENQPPTVQAAALIGACRTPHPPVSYELAAELALRNHPVLSMEFLLANPGDNRREWGRVLGATCSSVAELDTLPNDIWSIAADTAVKRLPSEEFWNVLNSERASGTLLGLLIAADNDASKLAGYPELRVQAAISALSKNISDDLAAQLVDILLSSSEGDSDAAAAVGWALRMRPALLQEEKVIPILVNVATIRDKGKIRVMQVGPFKHRVDDGLPIRTAAYESLLNLLPICSHKEYSNQLLDAAIQGMSDEGDVPATAMRLLVALGDVTIDAVASRAGEIHEKLQTEINRKVKDSMPKQDHDRRANLLRTIADTHTHLNRLFEENGLAIEL